MIERIVPSFNVDIHMAGDIAAVAHVLQQEAARKGMCVTLTPQTFIYSGGREDGFRVGLINYPRFPKTPDDIVVEARVLADWLRAYLGQVSYSITTPTETIWMSVRNEDPDIKAELLAVAERMAALEDGDGMRFPTRAETAWAREVIEKAKQEGHAGSTSSTSTSGTAPSLDKERGDGNPVGCGILSRNAYGDGHDSAFHPAERTAEEPATDGDRGAEGAGQGRRTGGHSGPLLGERARAYDQSGDTGVRNSLTANASRSALSKETGE
ncbi:hypothetical protein GR138_12980 [Shinella kummerowiae]|uniref:Uncharacterized protein n=1 Tax=Shinella kummerowiae TaxID=417745 RepID=A0A6N8SAK7_9HYPH|nr:hypothetical protein [Shinella kummerowiae]MXN46105.1 hypothetical protein [Shinella kummerowiae]